jgi:hypothetical protein
MYVRPDYLTALVEPHSVCTADFRSISLSARRDFAVSDALPSVLGRWPAAGTA